ncbi:MAG: hypothetical protein OXG56_11075 [Gammaproteobacteria bacterium]|nr:hypothetical protein [Gammaproteobacteria bacterium]
MHTDGLPSVNTAFEPGNFGRAAGFEANDLLGMISVALITIVLVWAAWALFSVTLNSIARARYGTWIAMLGAIVLIVTLMFVFIF